MKDAHYTREPTWKELRKEAKYLFKRLGTIFFAITLDLVAIVLMIQAAIISEDMDTDRMFAAFAIGGIASIYHKVYKIGED